MLRVFSRRLYNEKLFNQVPNVRNNLKNNLSFICCNNNDTSFLNVSKNVQASPVKVNTNFPNFHVAKRYKQKKDKAAKTKQVIIFEILMVSMCFFNHLFFSQGFG